MQDCSCKNALLNARFKCVFQSLTAVIDDNTLFYFSSKSTSYNFLAYFRAEIKLTVGVGHAL